MTVQAAYQQDLDESIIIEVDTDDFEYELKAYETDLLGIYNIIINDEADNGLTIGASKFIAQQRKLAQKRGEVLNKKFNDLKKANHDVIKVGGQIIVTARKLKLNVQDMNAIQRNGGTDAQLAYRNKLTILTHNIQGVINASVKI